MSKRLRPREARISEYRFYCLGNILHDAGQLYKAAKKRHLSKFEKLSMKIRIDSIILAAIRGMDQFHCDEVQTKMDTYDKPDTKELSLFLNEREDRILEKFKSYIRSING